MTRRTFLGAAAAPALASAQGRKRNIVFILSDDHRFDMMSAMGHPWLETPNLDRMIRTGVHFRNAFVTTSLCSPSRASILSGQYVHAHRVMDNSTRLTPGLLTFPEVLQQNGYKTGFVGKWHMGGDSDEPRPGFDHWVSFAGQGTYFDPTINFNGERRLVEGYNPDILTEEAKSFLEANKDGPFFLYLSHKSVHGPFQPAPRHRGSYEDKPIPYPETFADTDENYHGKPDWLRRQRNSWHGVDGLYNNRVSFDQFYRDYAECVRSLDDSIGEIMDKLAELGQLADTLILYMGDNGFLHGEHGLIDKRAMYEPSIRVPLIAHCPTLCGGGKVVDEMVLNIDIHPTLVSVAGAQTPDTVQGRSLLPLLEGKPVNWRKEFVYEYFWERAYPQTPTVIGLRTDQYSYMHYHGIWDRDELYDIRKDPDQRNNLIGDVQIERERDGLIERLKERNHQHYERVRDFQEHIFQLMRETGGHPEPNWFRA